MPIPQWAMWVLDNFTPGEIQAGYRYSLPVKTGKTPVTEAEKPYRIVKAPQRSLASQIPASTIHRFQQKTATPRERSLEKLRRFYRSAVYHKLKEVGASPTEAKKHSRSKDPRHIEKVIENYRKWVDRVARNKGVARDWILWGFTQSEIFYQDWEEYIRSTYT